MKWNKKFTYPKSVRSLVNDARHYEVGDEKLPSVTTILAATQSDEKRESIAKWIAKKARKRQIVSRMRQVKEALLCTII